MHTVDQSPLGMLQIDSSGVPIYVQLREQMLGAIGAGRLRPGERMPTMRQVAVALKIDLNTVKHAYDELERAGAITLLRGRGTFVAKAPPPIDRAMQGSRAEALAQRTIAAATASGIDPVDVARRIIGLAERKSSDASAQRKDDQS